MTTRTSRDRGPRQTVLASAPALVGVALVALALAGCGKSGDEGGGGPARRLAPVAEQGAVSVATSNTTRLGGSDPTVDAAAVARAVYPGLTTATRPRAAVVVDRNEWEAALAASVLAGAAAGAPILYADGDDLPGLTSETLTAVHPIGVSSLGGAQVVRIGTDATLPSGLIARDVPGGDPATVAAQIARIQTAAAGKRPRAVIVVASDASRALQMPAAGLAAESGAPILYVTASGIPSATTKALGELGHPALYVVAPATVSASTRAALRRLGKVTDIGPAAIKDPVANAIEVARFTDGTFGWGVKEPGHGLVFANATRPLDAPAAAPLSATGDYAPLLLLSEPGKLPPQLSSYLANIQPAYTSSPQFAPVRGVYNHGWLIGDESAIASSTQAEIDALLEISPRSQSPAEAAVSQSE